MHFHSEWFSVILRFNSHELVAFVYIFVECTLPRQSPIANRVLHQRQRKLIDVIDHHVMIFLSTYFRTTPVADVNFTSLVTSLITCHHCVSFTVPLAICKLQRILKGFTSLVAQRVFTSMMRMLACRIPCCRSQLAKRTIFGFGCERTIGAWIHACNTTMQYGFLLLIYDAVHHAMTSQQCNTNPYYAQACR